MTVSKTKSGRYLVSVQCEVEFGLENSTRPPVGIDLGLKDFLTLSTGEKVETPRYFRKSERKYNTLQRRLARKKKGSRNREKARRQLAKHAEHVANQRKDFHHKLSHRLVRAFGVLKFEDLHVKGMVKNRCLAKSIHDAGWSQFVQFCEYKAPLFGGDVQKIERWFPSSKLCSTCGEKKPSLNLKERTWTCAHCGSTHDRDVNAALNILSASTAGAVGSEALWRACQTCLS
ncbi:MAG: RNA-guided endonuclease TnpB family protein [Myxococcota bacterium]